MLAASLPAFCLDFKQGGLILTIRQRPSEHRPSPTKKDFIEFLARLKLELPLPPSEGAGAAFQPYLHQAGRKAQRAAA